MNHTELLNYLIKKHDLKSYLEIGVRDTRANFDKIICDKKLGVDPNVLDDLKIIPLTSDDFFYAVCETKFDLIFIDGLHHSDQVKKDFENSLNCLNDNGFIVLHDTCPVDESTTIVPRGTQKVWHGDVYKFAMELFEWDGIDFYTIDQDCGMTVVWKDGKEQFGPEDDIEVDFMSYLKNKKRLLNIINEPA